MGWRIFDRDSSRDFGRDRPRSRAGPASRAIDNAVAVGLAAVMLASMKNRLRALVYEKLVEADGRKMHPVARHLRNAASIVNELLPDGIRMDARRAADAAAPEPAPGAAGNGTARSRRRPAAPGAGAGVHLLRRAGPPHQGQDRRAAHRPEDRVQGAGRDRRRGREVLGDHDRAHERAADRGHRRHADRRARRADPAQPQR